MRNVKPFYESVIDQLNRSVVTFSKTKRIGLFICHFVTEVKTITENIIATEIPREHITSLVFGLEEFYKNFEDQYPRTEDGCGTKKERALIEKSLAKAIDNLKKRL